VSLEVSVNRSKGDVRDAIMQFAARKGFRATNPWYIEGIRIEDMRRVGENMPKVRPKGYWAAVVYWLTAPEPGPRVDIELKRRRGRTIAVLKLGAHNDSVHLAYALRSYLSDERAFELTLPPICPRCSASVTNFMATYCGRCGLRLSTGADDRIFPMAAGAGVDRASLPAFERTAVANERQEPEPSTVRNEVVASEASPVAAVNEPVVVESRQVQAEAAPAASSETTDDRVAIVTDAGAPKQVVEEATTESREGELEGASEPAGETMPREVKATRRRALAED
jgi:ribosomal protein S27AE